MWKRMKLGEAVTLQRGHDLPHKKRRPGPYPIVSSSGITGYHDEFKAEGPGVVTGRYGTLGEFFYIPGRYWPLNTALWVRDFKSNDPRFVYYFLQTLGFARSNVAGAVPGVNRNVLHAMEVTVPPLPTQRRIAGSLSAYDDLIENNTKRIKILEEMARALYRDWFVHFRFPGHEKVKFVDSPLGQIPEGWEVSTLGDETELQAGFAFKSTGYTDTDESVRLLRGHNIAQGYLRWSEAKRWPASDSAAHARFALQEEDVVLAMDRPWIPAGLKRARVGKVDLPSLLVQRVARLRGKGRYSQALLAELIEQPEFVGHVKAITTGANVPHISGKDIKAYPTIIPSRSIQDAFEEYWRGSARLVSNLKQQVHNLKETRDLLLPRLISGEIDVDTLDLPEPP